MENPGDCGLLFPADADGQNGVEGYEERGGGRGVLECFSEGSDMEELAGPGACTSAPFQGNPTLHYPLLHAHCSTSWWGRGREVKKGVGYSERRPQGPGELRNGVRRSVQGFFLLSSPLRFWLLNSVCLLCTFPAGQPLKSPWATPVVWSKAELFLPQTGN